MSGRFESIFLIFLPAFSPALAAAEPVAYELLEGSQGHLVCTFCLLRVRPVPLGGTFLLTLEQDTPPYTAYSIDAVDLRSTQPEDDWQVSGSGSYLRFEEAAVTEEMSLEVALSIGGEETPGVTFGSGRVARTRGFPDIEIDLRQTNPADPNTFYTLHLVAAPASLAGTPFRRGDSNGDGTVDLSDAVHLLDWLFLGGEVPGCLDASDGNGDRTHDLTDAVYLLGYLFLSGPVPPASGPADCGPAVEPGPGCKRYGACKAGG